MKKAIELEMNTRTKGRAKSASDEGLKAYIRRVFSYMGISLGITAAITYFTINTGFFANLIEVTPKGAKLSTLGNIFMWAPLVLVLGMDFVRSMQGSKPMLFLVAAVEGVSISLIVLFAGVHTAFQAFLLTGILFGSMALYGYATDSDLTKMGNILMMGAFGLMLVSIVGVFTGGVGIWFSYAVVVIFTLLVAYEVQMIKGIYSQVADGEELDKLAVMCALSLYLSFINIFVSLLRILGNNRSN
ncbi:MAG: Bax inhibitor-1/YccA family protein [Rickettsiales bacterium]|jgi:FtsH-binding integral membrane protein|nr:Bax inhibitor-1/YccA family protein [Rickettsiales bacterium]